MLVVKNWSASAGDAKDVGSIPGSERSLGGWHGNPLQYSCLENPTDRGAWWAIVHRVTKSRTQLQQLSTHACKWGKTWQQPHKAVQRTEWDDLNKTFSMVLGTCYSSLNLDFKHTNPTANTHTPEESLHTGNTFNNRRATYRWPTRLPPTRQPGPCVISPPFQAQWNACVTRNTSANHLTRGAEQRPQFSSFSLSASPSSHPTYVRFQFLVPLAWTGRTSSEWEKMTCHFQTRARVWTRLSLKNQQEVQPAAALSVSHVRPAWSGTPADLCQAGSRGGNTRALHPQPRPRHKAPGLAVPAEQPGERFRRTRCEGRGESALGTQTCCVTDESGELEDERRLGKPEAWPSHQALRLWNCTFSVSHLKDLRYFTPLASEMSHSPGSVNLSDHFIFSWAPLPPPACPLPVLVTRALSSAPHALLMLITMNTKKINYFGLREKSYLVWGMTVMLYLGQMV